MNRVRQSGFGVVEIVISIVVLSLMAGGGYYVYSQQNKDSKNASSENIENDEKSADEANTFSSGEEKADDVIELIKNDEQNSKESDNPYAASEEMYALLEEIGTYGAYDQNLPEDEKKIYIAQIGTRIGLFGKTILNGNTTKASSKVADNDMQLTTTVYKAEDPNAKPGFLGPHTFTIKTAYIDNAWRCIDFQVVQEAYEN